MKARSSHWSLRRVRFVSLAPSAHSAFPHVPQDVNKSRVLAAWAHMIMNECTASWEEFLRFTIRCLKLRIVQIDPVTGYSVVRDDPPPVVPAIEVE